MIKTTFAILGIGGFFTAVALTHAQPKPALPQGDAIRSPIEGEYAIESGEKDGKAIPADHFKGSVVRITGNSILGTDKERKEFFACTYVLEGNQEPWVIRMKSTMPKDGPDAMGLAKRSGDRVTIIYALPGGDTPTEFKTKNKQQMWLIRLKRIESRGGQGSSA